MINNMKKSEICLYNTIEVFVDGKWGVDHVFGINNKGITLFNNNTVSWKNVRGVVLDDAWFEDHCFENGELFSDQGLYYHWSEIGNNYVIKDSPSDNIISTVKYVHEAENLFAFLTGYDVVESKCRG